MHAEPLPVDPPCLEHRWLPLKAGPICIECGMQQPKQPCKVLPFVRPSP